MSNSTISALSSASTPLSGSEILPLNQSGVTNSVSVANLTAGRAVSGLSFAAATIGAPASTTLSIQANGTTYATILGAGTNNGYFGIGTTSPVASLHVVSASGGTTARFKNSGSGNFIDFYGSSRQGYVGCVDGTNFWVHSDSATGSIYFDTNNTTQATIDKSGNVLVGTTTSPGSSSHTAVGITGVFNNVSGAQNVAIATEYGGTITITAVQGGVGASTWVVPFINRSGTTAVSAAPTKAVYTADPIGSVTASGANIVINATFANTYISYFIQYVPMAA